MRFGLGMQYSAFFEIAIYVLKIDLYSKFLTADEVNYLKI